MRIALRTGGGRGVYELAGRQGHLAASDLYGREISYELTPSIIIPGRSTAALRQGKPRIALDDDGRNKTTHLYRLLSAVLLLPKPKREFRNTHGKTLIQFESYSMTAIKVDIAGLTNSSVVLRPTDLLLENSDHLREKVDFTSRMARVLRLWDAAQVQNSPLARLTRALAEAVRADDPDYKTIERRAQEIFDTLGTSEDALQLAEEQLGIDQAQSPENSVPLVSEQGFGLEDDMSPRDALVERVKVWRKQAERGSDGRRFSREVSTAYEYRCVFSGQRLPRLEVTDAPGVDSAHILPWSTHDLNSVRNGICLSKQYHWAFDQGILRLSFDAADSTYLLTIPPVVRQAASRASFDLGQFESVTGPIPRERLPREPSLWPSPTYIKELNRYMTTIQDLN